MVTYLEQIKELEDELKKTSYNKATQHHIGFNVALKAVLSSAFMLNFVNPFFESTLYEDLFPHFFVSA